MEEAETSGIGGWPAADSGPGAKCAFKLLNVSRSNKTKQTVNSAFTMYPQLLVGPPPYHTSAFEEDQVFT